ncbi:hypothetical protein Q4498_10580 [Neptunomonas phycophila]|nr:hypothetical protein [Neptunomonas phycophila]MDO6468565.1 hypothetical protein [Neptunomonas phycophila]
MNKAVNFHRRLNMTRKAYTKDEVVLCSYIALYDGALLSEEKISGLEKRSKGSVKMKVQNIAAMLDDKGFSRNSKVSALAGLPAGASGRETDWDLVSEMINIGKSNHWAKCKEIIARAPKQYS